MKLVVLIGGKKQHGKDTLAKETALCMNSSYKISSNHYNFADTMKDILIDLGIITHEWAYNSDKNALTIIPKTNIKKELQSKVKGDFLTVREVLQLFGNDIMKKYFGEKVWVDNLADKILANKNDKIVFVSDFRFHGLEDKGLLESLQNKFKNKEGIDIFTIYTIREGIEEEKDSHESENSLRPSQCSQIYRSRDLSQVTENAIDLTERILDILSRMK